MDTPDVDQGLSTPGFCSRGSCTNTAGSYVCLCPCGFASSLDSSRCLDQRAGTCFWVLVGGRCAKDLTGHDTGRQCCCDKSRSECCCASPDRGFGGPCQLCPARSSGEFWSLCSRGLGVPAEVRACSRTCVPGCTPCR
ncbi:Fibrillin-2 [Manis javanica]|nr:Fibrillin-2 [Manis javanica]